MAERPADIDIRVSEVGPRDGLQSIARAMPTVVKHRWIRAPAASGIDLDRLIAARSIIAEGLPGEPLYGNIPAAGLPKGFVYATTARAQR